MSYFLVSFVTLVVLGLTSLARSRYGPSVIPFSMWWQLHQLALWCVMAVAVLQSHVGCARLLAECYMPDYPDWLYVVKVPMIGFLGVWTLAAWLMTGQNIWCVLQGRGSRSA